MPLLLLFFASLIVLKLLTEIYLDRLNHTHVLAKTKDSSASQHDFIDQETAKKSAHYTLAKSKFSIFSNIYETVILSLILFTGLLPWLWSNIQALFGSQANQNWAQALTFLCLTIVLGIPSLPAEWWQQFRLEERFGFNKSTLRLWLIDKLKLLIISLLLGTPLLWLILQFVAWPLWWVWAFLLIVGFQIIMMVLYPSFIMPLFNKFKPLDEGTLRKRLFELAARTGFAAKTILVMDGSRRSSHSNAFFAGFGRWRRIVLFDTLMEQLNEKELEAVLAHEIGHYKKGHIPKMLIGSFILTGLGFASLGWLSKDAWFVQLFGFNVGENYLAPLLLIFSLLIGLITFWLTPILSGLSRRHEYEADAFASEALGCSQPLIQALRKLSEKNLSNLHPHPTYSHFYYSHPTLAEREAALMKNVTS